jgi:sugar-specific transcriptional regulator TrmB/DNA-binding CsgD family transcriptional regulator
MLDVLGLDPIEEATYRHLVGRPSSHPEDIARALELDPGPVGLALVSLEARGLVAGSTSGAGHYVASPPSVALGSLLLERQQDLRRAESELQNLMVQYRRAAAERTVTDVIDVVVGPQAVAQRFAQIQRAARSEVLALVQSTVAVVTAEENVEEEQALHRGVAYKVVFERALLDRPGFYDQAMATAAAGEELRVAPSLPLRLIVADREFALLPMSAEARGDSAGALLVHPSGLLDALLALFDHVWRAADPLHPGKGRTTDGLDEVDQQVLGLLMAGLTDQAVGSQLGMSLRTVQRRARGLMERAGVSTRIQLGREAERRGWLAG